MKKLIWIMFILVTLEVSAQTPVTARRAAAAANATKPKLVLTIIVDQFRYDYLLRFKNNYTAGLKQLLTRGAVFTNARYDHFPTYTAVGHSTILTGAYPAVNDVAPTLATILDVEIPSGSEGRILSEMLIEGR